MEIRKEVMEFALAMEMALQEHDKDRGDSWKDMNMNDLLSRKELEDRELSNALIRISVPLHQSPPTTRAERIQNAQKETVDVANFAMFIFHNLNRS